MKTVWAGGDAVRLAYRSGFGAPGWASFTAMFPPSSIRLAAAALLGLGLIATADPFKVDVRTTEPLTAAEEARSFHLPPGFEIQLVAAEPEIGKPINMAFDSAGRLWVTQSREYPFPAKPGVEARDEIRILEDFGPDGHARKISTFAAGLNIPMGIYPFHGGAIGYSVPNIYRWAQTDGHAGAREFLYGPYDYTRDTHGMTNGFRRGFDGWLYADHGFNNTSTIQGTDGQAITMASGHLYRMKLDGSHVEVWSHGEPNPFGLAFDLFGNLFSCDCTSKPLWQNLREAYYPSLGKSHDGLGFGPEMMQHQHGSSAISGLCYLDCAEWPEEYRGNLLVGNPVTCRIDRDRLEDHGSTRLAREQPDFLITDDPWFRPVYLELGPDGALYVADFYNRIIGHYEVPLDHPGRDRERGRIWRIVYRGTEGKAAPTPIRDLSHAPAAELAAALANANMTVRMLAMNELTDRLGQEAIETVRQALAQPVNTLQKVHALWILHRLGALEPAALAQAAGHPDRMIRAHAMRILGNESAWSPERQALLAAGLRDADGFVQRAAAESMEFHLEAADLPPLLELRRKIPAEDSHLVHTVRISLRDHLAVPGALARAGQGSREEIQAIADVCRGIPTAEAGAFLAEHLGKEVGWSSGYLQHALRYVAAERVEGILAAGRASTATVEAQVDLARAAADAFGQRGLSPSATLLAWGSDVTSRVLSDPAQKAAAQRTAAELAEALKLPGTEPALTALLQNKAADAGVRGAAAKALAAVSPASVEVLARALAQPDAAPEIRESIAQALGGLNSDAARAAVLAAFPGAAQRQQVKYARALVSQPEGAAALLTAVEAQKISPRLLQERSLKDRFNALKNAELSARLTKLTAGLPAANVDLQKTIDERVREFQPAKASAERGAKTFTTACTVCHSLGQNGGHVGPPLDGVGVRGLDRLAEDVIDPNRNVDPAFHPSTVTLKDGTSFTGLFRREEGSLLVFADATGAEVKVPAEKVRQRVETNSSLMPEGFGGLPPADFADLMAFLLAQAQPAK